MALRRAPVTPGRAATFFSNFAAQSSQVIPSTRRVFLVDSAVAIDMRPPALHGTMIQTLKRLLECIPGSYNRQVVV